MVQFAQVTLVAASLYMFAVELVATGWLIATHGWAWVPVVWGTMVPLLVLPFPAGLGVWALAGWGVILAVFALAYYAEGDTQ